MSELRTKVLRLYKHLQYLAKNYPEPTGPQKFRKQCREAFSNNKGVTDTDKIKALVAQARYVANEIEALYSLRKYRVAKKRTQDSQSKSNKPKN